MLSPGDVVIADFVGAVSTKRRPALVVSNNLYHAHRPDVILAVLTSDVASAAGPTDYVLNDWAAASLVKPTAFRAYLMTELATNVVRVIGRLSAADWQQVQARLRLALAVT
jgi:mRNA interferase MazF